ncbi:hypothetical protein SAY86_001266 [Trapa natans]|uniref:Pentatricopeptide repeat-containing protein n=1 Tax=Trapa natans TaxID=22666 RepID=A0AAN7N2Z1_TRANT|nr:hypothetical protein SAY86_001266 [Trapa natans]
MNPSRTGPNEAWAHRMVAGDQERRCFQPPPSPRHLHTDAPTVRPFRQLLHPLHPQVLHRTSQPRHLHSHIIKLGFSSHVHVATALINVYATSSLREACKLFDEMPRRNSVTWNVMVTCHARARDVESARRLFDEIPSRDSVSWSVMIDAYLSSGKWADGFGLFRQMLAGPTGPKPDQVTMGSVLSACAQTGSLGLMVGKSIHSFAVKNGWEINVDMGTMLIDMYAKCGLMKYALKLFKLMEERNLLTWTALICGSAQNGHSKEALALFEVMRKTGLQPNEMTFTGVLSACANNGLVEDGRRYFKMLEECGVKPRIQHYGCMVDLFGKAGLLEEAYELIHKMEFEPNVVVWGSYLAACKTHKRFDMAEGVIDRVTSALRPQRDGGVYMLISDLYVLNDKWDEARKIREHMLDQRARKVRGSSFIKTGE